MATFAWEDVRDTSTQERNTKHEDPLGNHLVVAKRWGKHGRVILQGAIDRVEYTGPRRKLLPLLLGVELGNEGGMLVCFVDISVRRDRADLGGAIVEVGSDVVENRQLVRGGQIEGIAKVLGGGSRAINLAEVELGGGPCCGQCVDGVLFASKLCPRTYKPRTRDKHCRLRPSK
jgi:hypothetical protein